MSTNSSQMFTEPLQCVKFIPETMWYGIYKGIKKISWWIFNYHFISNILKGPPFKNFTFIEHRLDYHI